MTSRKKKQENLLKRISAGYYAPKNSSITYSQKTVKKPIIPSKNDCEHKWEEYCKDENDYTKIEYYCTVCNEHEIKRRPLKKEYKYTILPHEIKNHGKAEYRPNFRKYPPPEKAISWKGNLQKKEEIFNRCIKNKRISLSENIPFSETLLGKIIPLLILDENAAHPTLIKKLEEEGYDGEFLGRGLKDPDVYREVVRKNAILVTEDEDFQIDIIHDKRTYDPIYIRRDTNQLMENLDLILKHMRKFEES
ncbi:MAG: hypothetical protein MAG458_01791 [Nitrosopumilus sp.]|nr:hypothetical protein [Nitrosopumilus sp.]